MNVPIVSIKDVSVRFGSVHALSNISIDIHPGEIFALLGPSGCGKSTLLRTISGFENPSAGTLELDGRDMTSLPPNRRPINMVFQSYAVFPHMSVADNVAYGLKMEGTPSSERRQRVAEALEQVHLADFPDRKPDQLSGGQRQRVALARALVKRPRLLLLDEPLSALDAKLRDAMRLELVRLQEVVGITFVIVTHDQSEAMAMADRIAVLKSGRLRQVASPTKLYKAPADAFVADFIGTVHSFTLQRITALDDDDAPTGRCRLMVEQLGEITLKRSQCARGMPRDAAAEDNTLGVVAIRPENIQVRLATGASTPATDCIELAGQLGDVAFQGQHSIVEIRTAERSLTAVVDDQTATGLLEVDIGTPVVASWSKCNMLVLPHQARV